MTILRTCSWMTAILPLAVGACAPPNGSMYDGGGAGNGGGNGGGCPNDLPSSCPAGAPGYAATVAPILDDLCVSCHSPGGTGSKQLLGTYAEVSANRGSVLDQVYSCRMPPAGSGTLTLAQRQDVLAWLVCGAPDD